MASKEDTANHYGVILAHREGIAIERIWRDLTGTAEDSMDGAQLHADMWTRKHGHGPLDTDSRTGFYAYADRISRPVVRIRCKRARKR